MTEEPRITPDSIEQSINELAEREMTVDELLTLDDQLEMMAGRIKESREKLKACFIAYIKAHGPITSGTVRWFTGEEKKVSCVNVLKTVEAVLAASEKANPKGYPLDDLVLMMTTQPFKPATAKKFIGDAADDLFKTETVVKLKQDGSRDRETLQKIDTKFLR